ncbi:GtrA family protein [Ancylobacter radicis]|uniref:GtrA family protein n=1 Tax=Ancylobacter radicis TaxID=2836179 RepID=A0ABS5R9I5_9HYPH|nr:GtrA family protein [Ancylobacter radicis]MBS9478338.1 GtrA family protein [Ancylobacter radicis]
MKKPLFYYLKHYQPLLDRFLRFGAIGILSGAVFTVVTSFVASYTDLGPTIASAIGYAASLPLNFLGNRSYSFRSRSRWTGDLARYGALHALNLLLTTLSMGTVVGIFELHYGFGIAAAVLLVPLMNFLIMNFWVFDSSPSPSHFANDLTGPEIRR